ncbi:ankyrin repeat domain-containing protein 40-like [Ornithodoros turicata]|uniref:ankyrin repeat domain-containing protein 40-like n=1 Tax=Ornithodoros turicata TaxID=34597 RepID=UPI00313879C7
MEVNKNTILEEKLREAACYGDEEAVKTLLERNVRINAQHDINGWTPLHWAAKRSNVNMVRYLLSQGADPSLTSAKGEAPSAITDNEEIRRLLGEMSPVETKASSLPITPHFVSHPPLDYKVDLSEIHGRTSEHVSDIKSTSSFVEESDIVLKLRIAYLDDPDFIEVELPRKDLTLANLLRTSCEELGADPKRVCKIRKLPNTIIRKDRDVQRLAPGQELELVLDTIQPQASSPPVVRRLSGLNLGVPPGYLPPPAQCTNGTPFAKSSYCINGTILY